jgi:adenylosuccinate synthase
MPSQVEGEMAELLQSTGKEFGATTGRPRRCGWFDAVALRRSIRINSVSGLCMTKLDVLDGLEEIRIAVGYRIGDEVRELPPVVPEHYADCEPVYENMPGWMSSTVGIKRREDLPANAQAYLARIEEIVGIPIDIISTGPDREETIVTRHPFD